MSDVPNTSFLSRQPVLLSQCTVVTYIIVIVLVYAVDTLCIMSSTTAAGNSINDCYEVVENNDMMYVCMYVWCVCYVR